MNTDSPSSRTDLRLTTLTPALYFLCVLLFLYPLLEVVSGLDSFDPQEMRWRYGAVGLLMDASALPLLATTLAIGTAHWQQNRRLQRALQVVTGILALCLVVIAGLFILDALQLRRSIRPEVLPIYDRLSLKALALIVANGAFLGFLAYRSFLASQLDKRLTRGARGAGHSQIRMPHG